VIASTGGALPEVVGQHMKTGILVPPRDPYALAEAIDFLIENPDIRNRIGKAARQRVLKTFTWENAARQMVNVYQEAIDAYR